MVKTRTHTRLTPEQRVKVERLVTDGIEKTAIASRFGITPNTVGTIARKIRKAREADNE